MWKNLTIVGLVLTVFILIYIGKIHSKDSTIKEVALEAAQDTLHKYKSKFNSQAGYIAVITAEQNHIKSLLSLQKDKNKDLINLLDSNKNIVTASDVKTETKYVYVSEPDTIYKGLKFTKTIQDDKWITETIKVDSNRLSRNLTYRDENLMYSDKKDNPGWFTGSTLTFHAEPKNPNTKVIGATSVSTVIDKRKPRLGFFIGPSLSIDKQLEVRPSISLGVGLTF